MRLSSYLAFAACTGLGAYLLADTGTPAAAPAQPRAARTAKLPAIVVPPAPAPIDLDHGEIPGDEPAEDDVVDVSDEALRGHAPITDPTEFAMVFAVGDVSYLRLSSEERADAHGVATLSEHDGVHAVVAPVAVAAMPAAYRNWLGKRVLVDGKCRARVVGFAEVSRISGEPAVSWDLDDDGVPITGEPPAWTVELVRDENVTLAAQLDGCTGTWARAEDRAPAAVADLIDEPALENAAVADLLATLDDELAAGWKEMGGEGDWRDAAEIDSVAWQHPLTQERWIFVHARHLGSCGEPNFARMAVYRAGADGKLRLATLPRYGAEDIAQVVDLDGDGQPEILMGDRERAGSMSLVDLADHDHEMIYVPHHSYGCGC